MRAVDGIAPCGVIAPVRVNGGPLVVSQQAMAGLLDSNGLPAGRDWRRRRRTDQLWDLLSY